jgi:hypothetical protein
VLFDPLNADSVVADFALFHEIVHRREHLRTIVDVGRRTVQLHEIQRFDSHVAQAVLDKPVRASRVYPSAT